MKTQFFGFGISEYIEKNEVIKMKTIIEKSYEVYKLKNFIRYNDRDRIKNESVLEHTAITSLISLFLCDKFLEANREKVLIMSLIHDSGELRVGEIPRSIKLRNPELRVLIEKLEIESVIEVFPEHAHLIKEFEEQQTIESKIVRLADIIGVLLYVSSEGKIGNKLMLELVDSTLIRYKQKCSELNIFDNNLVFVKKLVTEIPEKEKY